MWSLEVHIFKADCYLNALISARSAIQWFCIFIFLFAYLPVNLQQCWLKFATECACSIHFFKLPRNKQMAFCSLARSSSQDVDEQDFWQVTGFGTSVIGKQITETFWSVGCPSKKCTSIKLAKTRRAHSAQVEGSKCTIWKIWYIMVVDYQHSLQLWWIQLHSSTSWLDGNETKNISLLGS